MSAALYNVFLKTITLCLLHFTSLESCINPPPRLMGNVFAWEHRGRGFKQKYTIHNANLPSQAIPKSEFWLLRYCFVSGDSWYKLAFGV